MNFQFGGIYDIFSYIGSNHYQNVNYCGRCLLWHRAW